MTDDFSCHESAFSFRGRGYRGRGFTYTSVSQRQNFQNLPQSEKRANHKSTTNWYVELDSIKSFISNQPPFMAAAILEIV